MMIKKMLLLLLAAAVRSIARLYHEIIRKPNLHEGKYSLEKKTRVEGIFILADNVEKLKEIRGFFGR